MSVHAGRVYLIAVASLDVSTRCSAGQLVALAAKAVGGKGGGKADFAQAAGDDASAVQHALDDAKAFIVEHL